MRLNRFVFVIAICCLANSVNSTFAGRILGGTAEFTVNEQLVAAATPLTTLNAIFAGQQSYSQTLDAADAVDAVADEILVGVQIGNDHAQLIV